MSKDNIIACLIIVLGSVMIGIGAKGLANIKQKQDDAIVQRVTEVCKRD